MRQEDLPKEEQEALQRGIEDMEAGRTVSWESVKRDLREWWDYDDERSFWDLPAEELTWFGRLLHRIRSWFV